jgi:hypothetical protein
MPQPDLASSFSSRAIAGVQRLGADVVAADREQVEGDQPDLAVTLPRLQGVEFGHPAVAQKSPHR